MSDEAEVWKTVPGTNGRYEASSHGRVRATFAPLTGRRRGNANPVDGEVLRPYPGARGYLLVQLNTGDEVGPRNVAECLLTAFVGPRPTPQHRACFLNADRSNVHLSNLAWLTPKERMFMQILHSGWRPQWTAKQKAFITPTRWNLYHDQSGTPDSLSVEVVGRGNLLALDYVNYNGPSAAAIKSAVEIGLLLRRRRT